NRVLERFRQGLAAARSADALELEQAWLRIGLNVGVVLYGLGWYLWDRVLDDSELVKLLALSVFIATGVIHVAWIAARPGVHHPRRRVGVLLDVSSVTVQLSLGDEAMAVLCGFFLWIVIGNGFRFGR